MQSFVFLNIARFKLDAICRFKLQNPQEIKLLKLSRYTYSCCVFFLAMFFEQILLALKCAVSVYTDRMK